jgi:hypothetical protein
MNILDLIFYRMLFLGECYLVSGEQWAMSGNLWAVKKTKYLVIGPLVSYNRGLKNNFLGFNNKKIGKDKQHES